MLDDADASFLWKSLENWLLIAFSSVSFGCRFCISQYFAAEIVNLQVQVPLVPVSRPLRRAREAPPLQQLIRGYSLPVHKGEHLERAAAEPQQANVPP